jgi:outer membrane protein assembly factor BamE (lipoprotein component of BamABCDE complex)
MSKYIFLLLILTSCLTIEKGKVLDIDDINKIDIGISHKDNVIKILGFPSFKSDFNQNKWIYYSYKLRKFLFTKPHYKEQKVLVIDFSDNGEYVKNMTFYDIDTNEYKTVNNKTATGKEDENIIRDIFSNIGQIKGN